MWSVSVWAAAGVSSVLHYTATALSLSLCWYLSWCRQSLGEWYSFGPAPGAPAWEPASRSGPRRAGLALASAGPPQRSRLRPGLHNTQRDHTITNMTHTGGGGGGGTGHCSHCSGEVFLRICAVLLKGLKVFIFMQFYFLLYPVHFNSIIIIIVIIIYVHPSVF